MNPQTKGDIKQALEEIEDTIKDIEGDSEYDDPEYAVAMTHLYHHVNTAWNSRNSSDDETSESSEANFLKSSN